jgi:phosphonate transport system substrate-binding protein
MSHRPLYHLLIAILFFGLVGCSRSDEPRTVSLEKKETITTKAADKHAGHIRIAVGGMITPKEGFGYYKQFLDYIGGKLGSSVEFVDRENYAEINALIRSGKVDVAFVCGGPYVDGHDAFGMELLVAPQAYNGTVYYSYIIVAADNPARSFQELRGKSFAFTDPLSNSGTLVPTYMLAKAGLSPKNYFSKVVYTQSHDKSIKAVAEKLIDGAAVDSLIWEYDNRQNTEFTAKTKIIERSPPYGVPPVVVRANMDPQLKEKIRAIFLDAHKDERGREILKHMMIDKFVLIDDHAYDSIREMKSFMEKQAAQRKVKK